MHIISIRLTCFGHAYRDSLSSFYWDNLYEENNNNDNELNYVPLLTSQIECMVEKGNTLDVKLLNVFSQMEVKVEFAMNFGETNSQNTVEFFLCQKLLVS